VWSPDGKHIAFFRQLGEALGLFVIKPDRTEENKVTQFKPAFYINVAWSPDSRRLAFLRSFQTNETVQYTEIFSRTLDDSIEHQITFDKKVIDDFCWTSTGEIVFNSNRGGGVGLWVIPEEGGVPKQLTLGAGADRFPRISKDAKHLAYLNESQNANLWAIDLQSKELQQLTFEDAIGWDGIRGVAYSPDGSKLIYWLENSYESSQNGFVVCNRDGSEPTKFALTIGKYTQIYALGILWFPDMKSVYFNCDRSDTIRKNPDSIDVKHCYFEHEFATNVTRKIGDGILIDISWDGKYILYARKDIYQVVLANKSAPDKIIKEIAFNRGMPHFSWDSKSVIVQDSIGVWSIPVDVGKNKHLIKTPKSFRLISPMPDGKSILGRMWDAASLNNVLVKVHLINASVEVIKEYSGLSSTVSPDGKTLVFVKVETMNRIIVLDNFR
jgi:Tol biopolymer transport system component